MTRPKASNRHEPCGLLSERDRTSAQVAQAAGFAKIQNRNLKKGLHRRGPVQMNVKKKAKGCRAIIYRLNDSAERVSCWTLTAFPLKWTGPALNDKGSIVEVEESELQGEGLQFNV